MVTDISYLDRLAELAGPVLVETTTATLAGGASHIATSNSSSTVHIQVTVDQEPPQTAEPPKRKRRRSKKRLGQDAGPIHVLMALDASGSMASKAQDVIGGFNGYLRTLREDRQNRYRLTVVTFDTSVRTLYADLPLADVPDLDGRSYAPGGNTALLDAIGVSLDELTAAVRKEDHPFGTERVLVVIMTDGEENSSRRFTKEAILQRIQARQQSGNWTFVYLGEAADVWMAAHLGIPQTNTVIFNSSVASGSALGALAASTRQYAASGLSSNAAFGRTLDPAALGVKSQPASLPPGVVDHVSPTGRGTFLHTLSRDAALPADAQAAPATRQPPQRKHGSKSSSRGRTPAPATAP